MLVQALAEYAHTYLRDQLADPAFEEKPVPYAIEIDEAGRFLGIRERVREVTRGEGKKAKTFKQAEPLLVPKSPVNRNTGVHPLLACDALDYVLGPYLEVWTEAKDEPKHLAHHESFVDLIRAAADQTGDSALRASARFYETPSAVEAARAEMRNKKPRAGSMVVLSVRPSGIAPDDPGGPAIGREVIREHWRQHYRAHFGQRHAKGGMGMCLACGKEGPLAVTHEKVKGLGRLGGQGSGVLLMSFDKEAFRSYGWDRNANSPVSPDCAAAYVLALNDLLKLGEHRQGLSRDKVLRTRTDCAGVGFLYWTRESCDDDLFAIVENPRSEDVAKLLGSPFAGSQAAADAVDANAFYLLAVSGNGGRLAVRDWFFDSLTNIRRNLANWFKDLRIVDVLHKGVISDPPRLWNLLASLCPSRVEPDDAVNAERAMRLVQRALRGTPLNRSILAAAMRRLRVACGADRLRPERVGLVRMCVNDLLRVEGKGDRPMTESLDPNQDHPAHICGQLLAVYDGLQYQAQGDVGVTVADRYYGLACTFPRLAFPKIETLARAHLRKLRRDKPAAAVAIGRRLDELTERLETHGAKYPGQLSLEDQGRFVIGFHHQKSEDQRHIEEAKQRKTAQKSQQEAQEGWK